MIDEITNSNIIEMGDVEQEEAIVAKLLVSQPDLFVEEEEFVQPASNENTSFNNIDEDDNPYTESVTKMDGKDMILIDTKEEAKIEQDYIKETQNQDRKVRNSVIYIDNDDADEDKEEFCEVPEIKEPDSGTLRGNIDTLIKNQEEESKEGLKKFEQIREKTRRMSSLEGDQLISMFNTNQDGFVKRKEMALNTRNDIFGLNPTIQLDGNPCYDVLYGEKLLCHIEKNISCEHSFQIEYLKRTSNPHFKNF